MAYENINLWFAKDENNNIVTIDKINEDNKYKNYTCPICESKVIAKTGDIMSWHFAHVDAGKCDNEAQIHFWVKNELIKKGDKFEIVLEKREVKEFICKEIFIEKEYKTEFGTYRPDITILTENNDTIYFEVANTNKKKVGDYIDMWLDLNNIVVEVDSKDFINGNKAKSFKALYYKEKYLNLNKDRFKKLNVIKLKYISGEYTREQILSMNWFFKEINRYNNNEISMEELNIEIQSVKYIYEKNIIIDIMRNNKCNNIIDNYVKYNKNILLNMINNFKNLNSEIIVNRGVYDKIFGEYFIKIYDGNEIVLKKYIEITNIKKHTINIEKTLKNYKKIKEITNSYKDIKVSYSDNYNIIVIDDFRIRINNMSEEEIFEIYKIKKNMSKIKKQLLEKYTELFKNYILENCKDIELYCLNNSIHIHYNDEHMNIKCLDYCKKEKIVDDINLKVSQCKDRELKLNNIKNYILDKISKCGYKEQDVRVSSNRNGDIVISFNSMKIGDFYISNKTFWVDENIDNDNFYKMDEFINDINDEFLKYKKRIERENKIAKNENIIKSRTDFTKINQKLLNEGYDFTIKYNNGLGLYLDDNFIIDLGLKRQYILNHTNEQIEKYILNKLSKINNEKIENYNKIYQYLKMLEYRYSKIKIRNSYYDYWYCDIESPNNKLNELIFHLYENSWHSEYSYKINISQNHIQINNDEIINYNNLNELESIIISKLSNYVRNIKYEI